MKVIGIIGGIGAGKSTIVAMMNELMPMKIISADLIGHGVLKKDSKAYTPVIDTFGRKILDKEEEIDRRKLAEIVFSSPQLIKELNGITHPVIKEEVESLVQEYKVTAPGQHIILEAALLIESGLIELTDLVIAVHAEVNERTRRVTSRDNIATDQILDRMKAQKDWKELSKYADYTIDNNKGLANTKKQVKEILKVLKEKV